MSTRIHAILVALAGLVFLALLAFVNVVGRPIVD
jgi:hypothetical protein